MSSSEYDHSVAARTVPGDGEHGRQGSLRMAKRQVRFTPQDLLNDPRLDDESPDLWNKELSEVAQELLSSAVRCFAYKGYHATTTRDISAGASLSPAALYVHFPSKEFVLHEIVRSSHESALACARGAAVQDAPGVAEKLQVLVSRYTAWHARHHVAARVAQYELAALTTEHYEEIVELRHQTNMVVRGVVNQGVADGTFAPVTVNKLVRSMLSMSIDVIRWYRPDGPDSPEQLGNFYAELALKMASNLRYPLLSAAFDGDRGASQRH